MEKFEVNILGCGSAIPTGKHMTTAQLVNVHDRMFLVDCGEGTQTQIWKSGIKVTNMDHIFISHAHGDHFFGLIPLLSSLSLMLDRKEDINIFVPAGLKEMLELMLKEFCWTPFKVNVLTFDGKTVQTLYEDDVLTVETIPLKHGVPCCGFLFREKPKSNVLLPEKCLSYGISVREFNKIKAGNDYTLPDGTVIPNAELTAPSEFIPRSYAFCSDTAYNPAMIPQIKDVDLLYHETTFIAEDEEQAAKAYHSTTIQAATTARDANVGKLIVGHYSIRYGGEREFEREVQSVFPNAEACQEGMTFEIEHLTEEEKTANLSRTIDIQNAALEGVAPERLGIKVIDRMKIDMDNGILIGVDTDIIDAVIPECVKTIAPLAFKNCEQLARITIPSTVQDIGKSAFQGCKALQTITFPDNITILRESMFKWCSSLQKVHLPQKLEVIDKWVFRGCEKLEELDLPDSLQSIGIAAFQDCSSLRGLKLPSRLKYLQLNVFKGCPLLQNVEIPSDCLVFEGNKEKK